MPDVISNSSPLQYLHQAGVLDLLPALFGQVCVPEAVVAEQNIRYEREMEAALAAVDSGKAQICFLLNPVRVEQVMEIALGGEVLPQKSTDFYPKLLSGIAIYRQ